VIDGEREAALTFLAVRLSFPEAAAQTMMVVDIGAGLPRLSSLAGCGRTLPEPAAWVGSSDGTPHSSRSALAPEIDAVRAEIVGHLAQTTFPGDADRPCLVGVAGTVTSLAAMVQNLRSYDPALVHGYRLALPRWRSKSIACALPPRASAKPWPASTRVAPT